MLGKVLAGTETLELAEVHSSSAFYTPIEDRFERITRLARRALDVPVAAVTAVNLQGQWFKSVSGWDITELRLDQSLCEQTVLRGKRVIVPDLARNAQYSVHPFVTGAPGFRFYAGIPLVNARGTVVGTFCVMDTSPRRLDRSDRLILSDLAEFAQRELQTSALHAAQTELVAKLSAARRQALLDPLTRTWNRRGGSLLLEAGLALAKKNETTLAVLIVDIDNFKAVNDTFGHAAGDRALRVVAGELLAGVRHNDGVCRFGGDEFFVVFVDISSTEVAEIVRRVSRRIRRAAVRTGDGRTARISVCAGLKYVSSAETITADAVLAAADEALYRNKSAHAAGGPGRAEARRLNGL